MPDAFSLLMAFLPVLAYLGLIALVRVSGRCFVTTGGRDIAAVALAIVGLIGVGPAQLFFPRNAAVIFGPTVWLALLLLYGLVVILITLVVRPSMVVYGRTPAEVYAALVPAASAIDPDSVADPDRLQVFLPQVGVRLRCDGVAHQDFTRLLSFEPAFSPRLWRDLLTGVRQELARTPIPRRSQGWGQLILVGVGSACLLIYAMNRGDHVEEEFRRWLWR